MSKLRIQLLYNHYHLIVVLVVLCVLVTINMWFSLLLIGYALYLSKTSLFSVAIAISIPILALYCYSYYFKESKIATTNKEIIGIVLEIEKKDNYYSLICKTSNEKILIRDYTNTKSEVGEVFLFIGDIQTPQAKKFDNDFDYSLYLKAKGIYRIMTCKQKNYVKHQFVFNSIRYKALMFYEKRLPAEVFDYFEAIVFGVKNFEDDFKQNINSIGISHLFAISGMHILLLYAILKKIFAYFSIMPHKIDSCILIVLGVYVAVLGFIPSAFRAYLIIVFGYVNKRLKLGFSSLDILSLVMLLTFAINPLNIFLTSYQLSYLICFGLIICQSLFSSKNKLLNVLAITIFCISLSLPIVVNINSSINLLSIVISPLYIILFTYCIIPSNYLLLIMPFIGNLIDPLFIMLTSFINKCSELNFFIINLGYLNYLVCSIYYFIWYLLLKSYRTSKFKDYLIIYVLFIMIFSNIKLLNPYTKITFLNVGQGDSILIELPGSKGNILIDSFGNNLSYLKKNNITKLDYLILTHSDSDHIATAQDVINELEVKAVVINAFEDKDSFKISHKNIMQKKSEDFITVNKTNLNILGPVTKSGNKNDNSLVIQAYFGNYIFLFTGDMEYSEEKDLIYKYGRTLDCDVLKVGHHGSKTSSSKEFISLVSPKYSVISVGIDNKYNLPDQITLDTLSKSKILRTDKDNEISFLCSKDRCTLKK